MGERAFPRAAETEAPESHHAASLAASRQASLCPTKWAAVARRWSVTDCEPDIAVSPPSVLIGEVELGKSTSALR